MSVFANKRDYNPIFGVIPLIYWINDVIYELIIKLIVFPVPVGESNIYIFYFKSFV